LIPEAGGFRLEVDGTAALIVRPEPSGWQLDGGATKGWRLNRQRSGADGFVLRRAGEDEAGRTMRHPGSGSEAGLSYLLLDDGRLFRVVLRGPRDARFELLGWETPGAYLVARPEQVGWSIRPTAAGECLERTESMLILFAAEVLAADGGL